MISAAQKAFLLIFFQTGTAVIAQTSDSIPEINQKITYTTGLSPSLFETSEGNSIDTTLNSVHLFDPVDQADFAVRNAGNLGSAHFPLVFSPERGDGFALGYNQFEIYRFTKNNIRFYKNAHPYTRLNMLIGQRKDQIFEVEHSQNIRKKFNFGFHYKRFAANGAYQRQQTRHNDIAFTTSFDSGKRYLFRTELIFNSIRADENGGVEETGIFYDTSFVTKQLVAVELSDAENRRRDIYFHAYQSWSFKEKHQSAQVDSLDSLLPIGLDSQVDSLPAAGVVSAQSRKLEVFHEIDVGREKYEFTDGQPDSAYYGLFYYDDSISHDFESKAQKLFFGSGLGVRKYFAGKHALGISGNYAFNIIDQHEFHDKQFQDLGISVSFLKDTSANVSYGASVDYSFLDYTKADMNTAAFAAYDFGKAGKILADVSYSRLQPAWLYHRFSFENIAWNNDLNKKADLSGGISYRIPRYNLKLSVRFHNIDGLVYWDENRLPVQSSSANQVWVFELRKLFKVNYFGFDNLIRVQLISDNELQRYPVYWGVHSLYYERGVFKGKLLTKVGMDLRYNTNYKAYGYFPLTGQFHLQDEETLKFYPVLDVYVSFKIQTVRLFLIFNNVNQGMFRDKGYFDAYKYPADDRHFRFGVSWMFLD